MAKSPEEFAHLEWLGYVQPIGLVVSIPALLEAQCYVNKNVMGEHARFLGCLANDAAGELQPEVSDLALFTQQVLDWQSQDLVEVSRSGALRDDMTALEVVLPQYNETLRPTHVVPAYKPREDESPWMMLIQELGTGIHFDEPTESDSSKHWNASPHAKFERLLRESGVPIGLLFNGRQFRLVYAPRGETSGYATFNVDEMAQVAGRPMFAAFQMLLGADRVFNLAENQRLPHILVSSRKYQNVVSTALAEQVTSALFELLRGFQAANDQRGGQLLQEILANNPQHVYHGLLTVLMRLVFVLYAEDRGLVSSDPTYTNHYSVSGLFERLRSEAGRFPDTMDQRFGGWAQLLTLFRLVYEGGQHAELKIPARKGYLFDPERYPFLEGRFDDGDVDVSSDQEQSSPIQVPHISDGVVYRVLEDLLVLDGERLSYRTLDVEQIGSVYEAIMGFELQVSHGRSIAIKPVKSHGAPATIDLEELLAAKPADRAKRLQESTDQKLAASDAAALKAASTVDELVAALEKKIAKHVTPGIVPANSMVFQPSDERRRSGSHYTPRSLTEPIVRTTLEPILNQMCGKTASTSDDTVSPSRLREGRPIRAGEGSSTESSSANLPPIYEPTKNDKRRYTPTQIDARIRHSQKERSAAEVAHDVGVPHPWQILDLKICDPAMGSGAFLVEVCRQLGDELIRAWYAHDMVPADIPADEDEVLYARRLVAQRCLYGVDKNVMAVDLAKLSLWLVTLARDHAFTFLDHSLRHGDSLVGLTREQIIGFHWDRKKFKTLLNEPLQKRLDRATEARAKILNAREDVPYRDQEQRLAVADEALDLIRTLGDACVSCFFAESKKKAREEEADRVYGLASSYLESHSQHGVDHASRQSLAQAAARLAQAEHPVPAFHWEIEFPEVFSRENGGFDAFVGNPPFVGGTKISTANGVAYLHWILEVHVEATGNADLVAHFFRRAFSLLRKTGTFGLIATNTIGQGDTRKSGLSQIRKTGGTIYSAKRRMRWPGEAAVVVSVVHVVASDNNPDLQLILDGKRVGRITAYLFHAGGNDEPCQLAANDEKSFKGSELYGMGFTFDDSDSSGTASPISMMDELVSRDPRNRERIFPYIGGDEVNDSPTHTWHRYAIGFGTMSVEESRKWPDLFDIVVRNVKPQRDALGDNASARSRKAKWWQWSRPTEDLYTAIQPLERVLVCSRHQPNWCLCFMANDVAFSDALVVFALESSAEFAVMQSTCHEQWARFFASSIKDDLRYTPTRCFETFPFPDGLRTIAEVSKVGEDYYEFRSRLMAENEEGLTKTYNRFHSPDERDEGILELRRLHGLMDGAVLRAYGWDDLAESASCEFLLDYEEEEDDESPATGPSRSSQRSRKKKPWRYRWPDDFRDEVLARLLELNEQRHKEEQLVGKLLGDSNPKKKSKPKSSPAQSNFLED